MDEQTAARLQNRWDDLSGEVVRIEQSVPAPPAEVYAAFLDADRLREWWWPQLLDTTYEVDPQVGGRFRTASETAGFGAHGEYLYLGGPDAPLIWHTWLWETGGSVADAEIVRIAFDEQENCGTNVVLEHRLATPDIDPAGLTQGWTDVLARLAQPAG